MALSEIVNVQIQAGTVNPARAGFGIPLLLTYHTGWAGTEVRRYTTFSGLAADFASTTMVYKMAAAMFAQNPRPSEIKVGRLPAPASAHTTVIDFTDHPTATAITGTVYHPDGTTTALNVAWSVDIATTLAALKAVLDPLASIGTCTVASPLITVPAATNGPMVLFAFSSPTVAYIRDTTADWGYDTSLTAHAAVDGDWYGVLTDCNSPKNMDKVARWALTNDRFAFFGPQYSKPSQFVSGEFTAGADHTALLANTSAASLFTRGNRYTAPEAAWVGTMFPRDPGSATWAYKALAGVGADTYNATERGQIEDATRRANHYTSLADVGITRPGKSHGNEWIDVTIGLAWLEARLQERIYALLVNNPKIPYTDEGIAKIVAEVRAQLREAEDRGILDAGWTTSSLAAAVQASADRAARILRGVEFQARLAGAIHTVNVVGTVTA